MTTLYVDNIAPNLQSKISAPNLQLPSGSVLQVVESNMSGEGLFNTTSTTFVDVGLSATITPASTSNKILIQFNAGGVDRPDTANEAIRLRIVEGASNVIYGENNLYYSTSSTQIAGASASFDLIHNPSTTSAVTYKIQMRTRTGGGCSMNAGGANQYAVLLLTEIAG